MKSIVILKNSDGDIIGSFKNETDAINYYARLHLPGPNDENFQAGLEGYNDMVTYLTSDKIYDGPNVPLVEMETINFISSVIKYGENIDEMETEEEETESSSSEIVALTEEESETIEALTESFEESSEGPKVLLISDGEESSEESSEEEIQYDSSSEGDVESYERGGPHTMKKRKGTKAIQKSSTTKKLVPASYDPDENLSESENSEPELTRDYLLSISVVDLKYILKNQNKKLSGKKADLINRILDEGSPPTSPKSPPANNVVVAGSYIETDLKGMKVTELKVILKSQGKKVGGKKADLISRILGDSVVAKSPVVNGTVGTDEPHTEENLKKLKVAELKDILRSQGKKLGGKKADLINRILNGGIISPESTNENPELVKNIDPESVITLPDLDDGNTNIDIVEIPNISLDEVSSDIKIPDFQEPEM